MAAITFPNPTSEDDRQVRGARARAAAVRSRAAGSTGRRVARPALFAGDGQLRRPAPPVRLTSVPLVAHDDLAVLDADRSWHPEPASDGGIPVAERRSAPSAATYRRRRLVAAALVLGALLAGSGVLGALGGGSLTASERGSSSTGSIELQVQPVGRSTTVVEPGDTLWSIARALQPEGDVRPLVDTLAAARSGRPLEVGETIVLP